MTFLLALVAQLGLEAVRDRSNRLRAVAAATAMIAVGGALKLIPKPTRTRA